MKAEKESVIDILKGKNDQEGIFVQEVKLFRNDAEKSLMIKEEGLNVKLKKITLTGISEQTIGIKLDSKGNNICNLFNKAAKNINKGSDALIYTECVGEIYKGSCLEGKKYILIIDLKSDVPKGFEKQMKSTKAFTVYIEALVKAFYPQSDIDEYEFIFILFSSKSKKPKGYTQRRLNKYGEIKEKYGITYLNCHAIGENYSFHLKKIIDNYGI